jgi:hypothetical protein
MTLLAIRSLRSVLGAVNRLFAFARSIKGQYWLGDYEVRPDRLPSEVVKFGAKIMAPDGKWQDFIPGTIIHLGGSSSCSPERFLKQADWRRADEYVASNKGEPLVGRLLANAEALADQGHTRSAMIEAVTATEVALNDMARNPAKSLLICSEIRRVLAETTLQNIVQRLGLTAAATILVPIVIPKADLPNDILATCGNAIVQRNNVVHNGQRRVDPEKLPKMIRAIRELCEILQRHTERSPINNDGNEIAAKSFDQSLDMRDCSAQCQSPLC